jgi:RAQPRD family integrative conjugative element protein
MICSEEVIAVIKRLFLIVICMVMILPSWAVADADGEREVLARLRQELQTVEALIREAEQQADLTQESTFAYHDLRRDLAAVQAGIEEYIAGSRRMPRVIEPLIGTYQR